MQLQFLEVEFLKNVIIDKVIRFTKLEPFWLYCMAADSGAVHLEDQ